MHIVGWAQEIGVMPHGLLGHATAVRRAPASIAQHLILLLHLLEHLL